MNKLLLLFTGLLAFSYVQAQTIMVRVEPTPSSAEVSFDQNVVIKEGNVFTMRSGEAVMTLRHDSYATVQEIVRIEAGKDTVLRPAMKKLDRLHRFYNHSGKTYVGFLDLAVATKDMSLYTIGIGLLPMRFRRLGLNLFNVEIPCVNYKHFDRNNFDYELRYRPELKYYFPISGHLAIAPYLGATMRFGAFGKYRGGEIQSQFKFEGDEIFGVAGTSLSINLGTKKFRIPMEVFGEYKTLLTGKPSAEYKKEYEGFYFGTRLSLNWFFGIVAGLGTGAALVL